MPLDDYRRKRNYSQSPEPAGGRARRSPGGRAARSFCVQKHLASHLHYDFRLEHDGVLMSWAVPKGPSLDPTTRRLAMRTEDHPVEYGEFEGVIPSGYGAGIVMLWDRGTWTPEVDDVDEALRKGDLKFMLDGYKLKGSWVLVRTKGGYGASRGGGDRSWLLIKHRDHWSGDLDIAEFAPLSVKCEGDFADILAAGDPDIWRSERPAKSGETGKLFDRIIRQVMHMTGGPAPTAARPAVRTRAVTGARKPPSGRKRTSSARAPRTTTAGDNGKRAGKTTARTGAKQTSAKKR